jgi:acetyl esterase/lipase
MPGSCVTDVTEWMGQGTGATRRGRSDPARYVRDLLRAEILAGVPVTYRCYEGMIHGFVGNASLAKGRPALAELIVDLRLAFHRRDLAV